jgi:hypothetical protein
MYRDNTMIPNWLLTLLAFFNLMVICFGNTYRGWRGMQNLVYRKWVIRVPGYQVDAPSAAHTIKPGIVLEGNSAYRTGKKMFIMWGMASGAVLMVMADSLDSTFGPLTIVAGLLGALAFTLPYWLMRQYPAMFNASKAHIATVKENQRMQKRKRQTSHH